MENSRKIMVGDNAPHWYLAFGDRWVGPLSATEIYDKIQAHEISLAHYVWKKGQTEWKRICDLKIFAAAVPHAPLKSVQQQIKKTEKPTIQQSVRHQASSSARHIGQAQQTGQTRQAQLAGKIEEKKSWFLYYNDSQFGPFTEEEIRRFLKVGKINLRVFAWQNGMKTWERLELISTFQGQKVGLPASKQTFSLDQRQTPRRPLIAKILISDDQSVIVGVCRDISVGGLQVLTERIPANVGAKLKMNISPSTNEAGNRIEPFVAEGVIVRILEDGRGFSFRFEPLSETSRRSIESYFASPQ